MLIRKATVKDFKKLYSFGLNTPELKVNHKERFMSKEEFLYAIKNKNGVLLLAEENGEILGFIYADTEDVDRPYKATACLVYIAVSKKFRSKGIASSLYNEGVKELKKMKITNIYAWANPHSGVINFLEKQGLAKGHECVWMDRKI